MACQRARILLLAVVGGAGCRGLLGLDGLAPRDEENDASADSAIAEPPLTNAGHDGGHDSEAVASTCVRADWLKGFAHRLKVPIASPGPLLTDYQVRLLIDMAGAVAAHKLAADASDVRVTARDGLTLLPHWSDPSTVGSAQAIVWTRLNAIEEGGSFVYVYYGARGVPATSNLTATFVDGVIRDPSFRNANDWYTTGPDHGGRAQVNLPGACSGGCVQLSLQRDPDPNGSIVQVIQAITLPPPPKAGRPSDYALLFDQDLVDCMHCLVYVIDGNQPSDLGVLSITSNNAAGLYRDRETKPLPASWTADLRLQATVEGNLEKAQSIKVSFSNLRLRRFVKEDPRAGVAQPEETCR